jgi:hypothetical protein
LIEKIPETDEDDEFESDFDKFQEQDGNDTDTVFYDTDTILAAEGTTNNNNNSTQ